MMTEAAGSVPCDCGEMIRLIEHCFVAWCPGCGQEWDVDWDASYTKRAATAEGEPITVGPGPLLVDE